MISISHANQALLADKRSRYGWATAALGTTLILCAPFLYFDPSIKNELWGPAAGCVVIPAAMWLDYFLMRYRMRKGMK